MAKVVDSTLDFTVEEVTELRELIRRCEASREVRRAAADSWRAWYELGASDGMRARYNKLYAHLNQVGAFLFSPGTVRFGVYLAPNVRDTWLSAATVARDEFRQIWDDANADAVIDGNLEWALVYGSTAIKLINDGQGGFRLCYIQPWDIGVSREDVPDLEEQDVICHWYTISIPQVERWVANEKHAADYIALAKANAMPSRSVGNRNRLVVSSISGVFPSGTISGGFPGEASPDTRSDAVVEEPTVEFVDVWERRQYRRRAKGLTKTEDQFEDWRVTTLIAKVAEPIAQRRNPELPWTKTGLSTQLPAELPFVVLAPRPIPDYLWGRSELENLTELQAWMDDYLDKIKGIVDRNMDPAKFFSGVPDVEEMGRALSSVGGLASSPEPSAKMETIQVQLTGETMALYGQIQGMFADESGIPQSIADPGQMGGGIRSQSHFAGAASVGAGRLRKMALKVETTLGLLATKAFHLLQRSSTEVYSRDDGPPFLLGQIPSSVRLTVNAHSASPIFAEQTQQKALVLHKAGAIDGEDLVELFDPPNRDELKHKARKIAENKAKMVQEKFELEHEKVEAKMAPKPKK